MGQQSAADRGQQDALGVLADEELDAELLLQLAHRRRDRGLGDVELGRGPGHAAPLGGGDEVLQLAQGESQHGRRSRDAGGV